MAILGDTIQSVTFRSQLTPPYTYDPRAPSAPPSNSGWVMPLVKPAFDLQTIMGPFTFAPYGEPTEDYVPIVAIGGIGLLVGIVLLVGWIARKTKSA